MKLWPQEVYFSWFSNIECLRDENNRYLYNATENVRLYCKLFEIHFCIKSDCICCLYFLSLNKRFFGPFVLLPHIFRQEFPLIYLNNVYHKAPDISLYYLPISRLKWKKPSCFQLQCAVVAWNRWNRVFLLSLRLHLRLPCFGSHVWNANASANVSARKWHFFHFLRLSLRLHFKWCSSHVYFPAFAFASHVWTRLKTKSVIYLTLLSYTPKNSGCLAHQILMTYSRADFPVGSGTLLKKSRVIWSWVFIRWRKESTSDCEIRREKALGFRNWLVVSLPHSPIKSLITRHVTCKQT